MKKDGIEWAAWICSEESGRPDRTRPEEGCCIVASLHRFCLSVTVYSTSRHLHHVAGKQSVEGQLASYLHLLPSCGCSERHLRRCDHGDGDTARSAITTFALLDIRHFPSTGTARGCGRVRDGTSSWEGVCTIFEVTRPFQGTVRSVRTIQPWRDKEPCVTWEPAATDE